MSVIVAKPAGESFRKKDAFGEIIFSEPVAINYVYVRNGKLIYKKHKSYRKKIWDKIDEIKKYPALIYICEDEDVLKFKKSNWCPVLINKNVAIIGAGEVRAITNIDRKFIKNLALKYLRPMMKDMPNFLFTEPGKWMMEKILSFEASMLAINKEGTISIYNQHHGHKYGKLWAFDSFITNIENQRTKNNYWPYC